MKLTSPLLAALASLALCAVASADEPLKFTVPGSSATSATPAASPAAPAAAPAAPAAPAKPTYTDVQLAEAYGWLIGEQSGLRQLEFSKDQVDAIARGLTAMAAGGQPPFNPQEIGPELKEFIGKKNEAFMTKLKFQQMEASKEFFTKLKENKNVVELPSGLRYEILKPATGALPKMGQTVSFNYVGALLNGQIFDRSTQPIEFPLQEGAMIAGMVEGLQKVGVGGKARLYIPPSLGYGDQGAQGIPPGATLIFEIEVVGAKDGAPAAPAAGK